MFRDFELIRGRKKKKKKGTDSDGGDLPCSGINWGIHGWTSVALGGAAAILGAEMNIDSKEAQSLPCFPMGDKWFTSGIPSGIERVDAAGVKASSIHYIH